MQTLHEINRSLPVYALSYTMCNIHLELMYRCADTGRSYIHGVLSQANRKTDTLPIMIVCCFMTRKPLISFGVKKGSSYIAQYPVLRTAQSALHFTSLTDLFTHIPSRLLWEASSHMLQLMREGCSYTYPPLSIVRYSFKQLSELEQCRVKKIAQGFNTAARIRTRVLVVESPKLYP